MQNMSAMALVPVADLQKLHEKLDALTAAFSAQRSRKLDSAGAAVLCGRIRPDGTANLDAFKTFLQRHPDLPREKAGRRLVFDEASLKGWLERQSQRRAA